MENKYGTLDALRVTVLMEETAAYNTGLLSQHGVSFLLETWSENAMKTVLFDTGQSAEPLLHNMEILGKNPADIDIIFLSHCHSDHTGGLIGVLEAIGRPVTPVIAHPSVFRSTFSIKPVLESHGMRPFCNPQAIVNAGGDLIMTEDPLPLMPGALSTGEIKERTAYEKKLTLSAMTVKDGKLLQDQMEDDMSLVFIVGEELVIVSGCSHAGIVSIAETAISLTGIDNIAAIIGGFHLINADEERIGKTIEDLSVMKAAEIYTGHCTGFKAEAKMHSELGNRFHKMHTGMIKNF